MGDGVVIRLRPAGAISPDNDPHAIAFMRVTVTVSLCSEQDDDPDVSYLERDADSHESSWRDFVARPDVYPADPDLRAAMLRWPWLMRAAGLYNAEQDANRLAAFNCGDWYMMGIWAKAEVHNHYTGHVTIMRSGGLWGIESDSGVDYMKQVGLEQLQELRADLAAMGMLYTEPEWSALLLAALDDWDESGRSY